MLSLAILTAFGVVFALVWSNTVRAPESQSELRVLSGKVERVVSDQANHEASNRHLDPTTLQLILKSLEEQGRDIKELIRIVAIEGRKDTPTRWTR